MKIPDPSYSPRRILIRSTNWVGDAVMTMPAVRAVRMRYPHAHITVLALPWVADLFRAGPYVDEVLLYERGGAHRGIVGMLRLARSLAAGQFDMAILLQNAFEAALLTRLAGIPIRAGYGVQGRSFLLTHPVPVPERLRRRHQVLYYLHLVNQLGMPSCGSGLALRVTEAAARQAHRLLPGGPDTLSIGINPGAAFGPAKRWPAAKLARLAAELTKPAHSGRRIVIFGTMADREAAAEIVAAAPDAVDLTGRTTLLEAMACIQKCAVFVTNDSGLMHVAAALDVPLVALFGSTSSTATGPWARQVRLVELDIPCRPCFQPQCRGDFRCMEEIAVQTVEQAVESLLEEQK